MAGLIAHDWIESVGGAESVLLNFCEAFPDSEVFTLWNDAGTNFAAQSVRESWLAKTPLKGKKALALPFMSSIWRSVPNRQYEWILVSSHLFAHHIDAGTRSENVPKFSYIHSPARYLWAPELDTRASGWLQRQIAPSLRSLDRRESAFSGQIAVNSEFIGERVTRAWQRDDYRVIYPPVDVARFRTLSQSPISLGLPKGFRRNEFLLAASRLVPYKGIDHAIKLAAKAGVPIVVAGAGPDRARLEDLAASLGAFAHFTGPVSQHQLASLYSACLAYCAFAVEDFGIMPVEAVAAGAKVLANSEGGISESIKDGVSGIHCNPNDLNDLSENLAKVFSMNNLSAFQTIEKFAPDRFQREINSWVSGK